MLFPFGDVDFVLLNIGRVRNVANFSIVTIILLRRNNVS